MIQHEYNRWSMMQNILRNLSPSFHDLYNHPPGILEAWIISAMSELGIKKFDEGEKAYHYLRDQLERTGHKAEISKYEKTIDFMFTNFKRMPKEPAYTAAQVTLHDHDRGVSDFIEFSYGPFSKKIERERGDIFLRLATLDQILSMLMRYAFIMVRGSHQWAAPLIVYKNMIKHFGVSIEGFGSPLNSRMLLILQKKEIFCSLFPDTDEPFGSRGNFFKQDFAGKNVFINPPFLCNIIDDIRKKIEETLRRDKSGVYIVCIPEWPEEDCYIALMKSKYLKYHYTYTKFNHWYESNEGKIRPTFNSTYFLFADKQVTNKLDALYIE